MQQWICKILLLEFVFHYPNISLKLMIPRKIIKHFAFLVLIFFLFFSMLNSKDITISMYFFLCIYMIINRLEICSFFLKSTFTPRKIKSLFWLLVANANSFCHFFLAYNLTYILKFAIYGWLVTICSQPHRYCPRYAQRGPHGFKTDLHD